MSPVRPLAAFALLAMFSGCYQPETTAYSTFPQPVYVQGPPGGEMDPAYGYPAGYPEDGGAVASFQVEGEVTPSADPTAAGYVMGTPTNAEIDSTLSPYGEWIEVDGYGLVWRPYTSAVGLDFTPYESCGSWVWTEDHGWTFACEWDWGWLPFHYGRWGWFEDYWAWQPGYEWSPAWVEWRSGEDYCGWRPQFPEYSDGYWDDGTWVTNPGTTLTGVAYQSGGWNIRDHRHGDVKPGTWTPHHVKIPALYDSQWRFAKRGDFGKKIRPNLFKNPAEGLRVTTVATRPPMKGSTRPVAAASIMRGRIAMRDAMAAQARQRRPLEPSITQTAPRVRSPYDNGLPPRPIGERPHRSRSPDPDGVDRLWPRPPPVRTDSDAPHGRRTETVDTNPRRDYRQDPLVPSRDFPGERASRAPMGNGNDRWDHPVRPTSPPPRGSSDTWSRPSRSSSSGSDDSWSRPSHSSSSSNSSSSSRHSDPPSHSTSSSSGNWSPPSRSSSSGSSHSSGGGGWSRGSGGGGFSGGSRSSGGTSVGGGGGRRR